MAGVQIMTQQPPLKISEAIDHAADSLSKPGTWCQKASFRNAYGDPTSQNYAASMCAGAAVELLHEYAFSFVDDFTRVKHGMALTIYNDRPNRTQDEVVQMLRDAAEQARKEGR